MLKCVMSERTNKYEGKNRFAFQKIKVLKYLCSSVEAKRSHLKINIYWSLRLDLQLVSAALTFLLNSILKQPSSS